MLEFESLTKAKVMDVRVLAAKDRGPDDPHGAQLLLQATLSADALTMLDGSLKSQLYCRANAKQGAFEGMEGMQLTSFAQHVKRMAWEYEQTGCTLTIDFGTGGTANIVLLDCKVHRVSLQPKEGGSVVLQWTVDAPGLEPVTWAKLPGLKATETQILLSVPEPADEEPGLLDDDKPARGRRGRREAAAMAH
jgi:hypothetical protein